MRIKYTILMIFALALNNSIVFAADMAAGEQAYVAKGCMGCHGPAGNSANPAMFPSTAGLAEAYIIEQINAFKNGTRNNPMMTPMVAALTDEEIANIAAYLASQK